MQLLQWHQILKRFHRTSQVLQSADEDLNTAVALYESLIEFVHSLRTRFEEFEAEGKKLSECNQYAGEIKACETPADNFRTGIFLIIESLDAEWRKRLSAYTNISERFGFLRKLADLPAKEVVKSAKRLEESFPTDLEAWQGLF